MTSLASNTPHLAPAPAPYSPPPPPQKKRNAHTNLLYSPQPQLRPMTFIQDPSFWLYTYLCVYAPMHMYVCVLCMRCVCIFYEAIKVARAWRETTPIWSGLTRLVRAGYSRHDSGASRPGNVRESRGVRKMAASTRSVLSLPSSSYPARSTLMCVTYLFLISNEVHSLFFVLLEVYVIPLLL